MRACYQRHTGGFGGADSLEVVFTIDAASGSIKSTKVPARGALTAIDQCISRAVDRLGIKLPRARQDTVQRYTFEL